MAEIKSNQGTLDQLLGQITTYISELKTQTLQFSDSDTTLSGNVDLQKVVHKFNNELSQLEILLSMETERISSIADTFEVVDKTIAKKLQTK